MSSIVQVLEKMMQPSWDLLSYFCGGFQNSTVDEDSTESWPDDIASLEEGIVDRKPLSGLVLYFEVIDGGRAIREPLKFERSCKMIYYRTEDPKMLHSTHFMLHMNSQRNNLPATYNFLPWQLCFSIFEWWHIKGCLFYFQQIADGESSISHCVIPFLYII